MKDHLMRLFRYDDWANREEVAQLKHSPNAGALRLLAHIAGTEWTWLSRIAGVSSPMSVWPDLDLDRIAVELPKLHAEWSRVIGLLDLDSLIHYRNTKGEQWNSRAVDILTHVTMHGAYHRGQMATLVRAGGGTPAYTDFIHCTRIGAV